MKLVSVPLRGNGCETDVQDWAVAILIREVSVPLRGNGCETRLLVWLFSGSSSCGPVSVPLRGNGCETVAQKSFAQAVKKLVSVPLRGNGCETREKRASFNHDETKWFPSPCGVMGVKLAQRDRKPTDAEVVKSLFPSPCGVMGVKQNKRNKRMEKIMLIWFPSPCGVMGVKRVFFRYPQNKK